MISSAADSVVNSAGRVHARGLRQRGAGARGLEIRGQGALDQRARARLGPGRPTLAGAEQVRGMQE